MDNTYFTALIGVFSTLLGVFIGWGLSLQSYKIGRTVVYGTLTVRKEDILSNDSKTEYIVRCVVHNSRQIPVILDNFSLEIRPCNSSKTSIQRIIEPEINYYIVNGVKIGAETSVKPQFIHPRTLQEFSFKIVDADQSVMKSKLTLIAFDEKHKKQRFKLYDGTKGQK